MPMYIKYVFNKIFILINYRIYKYGKKKEKAQTIKYEYYHIADTIYASLGYKNIYFWVELFWCFECKDK